MTKYLPNGLLVHYTSLVCSPVWQALLFFGKGLFSPTVPFGPAVANWEASMAVRDRKGCKMTACDRLWRMIPKVLAGVGLVTLLWAPFYIALAQQEDVIESGQQQFNQRCVVCHGLEGKGNGALAPHLKVQPADLSRLSKKYGGTFPFWEVYGKIAGRDNVATHGPKDMPVWGTDERYEGSGGRLAMGQILEIVFFLQSIQEE